MLLYYWRCREVYEVEKIWAQSSFASIGRQSKPCQNHIDEYKDAAWCHLAGFECSCEYHCIVVVCCEGDVQDDFCLTNSAKRVYHKELTVSECCLISPSAAAFKILILLGSSCKARSYMSCAYKPESANVDILQITIGGLYPAWNLLLLGWLPPIISSALYRQWNLTKWH